MEKDIPSLPNWGGSEGSRGSRMNKDSQRIYRIVSYAAIKSGRPSRCVKVPAKHLYWLMRQARLAELLQDAKDVAYCNLNSNRREIERLKARIELLLVALHDRGEQ